MRHEAIGTLHRQCHLHNKDLHRGPRARRRGAPRHPHRCSPTMRATGSSSTSQPSAPRSSTPTRSSATTLSRDGPSTPASFAWAAPEALVSAITRAAVITDPARTAAVLACAATTRRGMPSAAVPKAGCFRCHSHRVEGSARRPPGRRGVESASGVHVLIAVDLGLAPHRHFEARVRRRLHAHRVRSIPDAWIVPASPSCRVRPPNGR
jgi:hypothetical protein